MVAGPAGPAVFISYAGEDRDWARWIAVELEKAGLTTVYQAADFPAGSDFVHEMHEAATVAEHTVAVLSPDYLTSVHGAAEWRAAYVRDPSGARRTLILVRVRPCSPAGLLSSRVYVDLVGLDEAAARAALLAAVDRKAARPSQASFPGRPEVRFPGTTPRPGRLGWSGHRYATAYRKRMLSRTRIPSAAPSLPTVGSAVPDLDAVFVDVSLVPRPQHDVRGGLLDDAPATVTDRHSIWHFLGRREPQALVLLGAPGSGKSTLLRHVVRRIAGRSPLAHRRWLPILVELRSHAAAVVTDPAVNLPELVAQLPANLGVPEPPGWWDTQLRRGRCVVLLDGLDEVTGFDARRTVIEWIRRQLEYYPDNHVVLSSRPYGYDRLRLDELRTLQVRPFTRDQVATFVEAWYRVTDRPVGASRRAARARAAAGAADMLTRLMATPALHDLMVNPLLLTMIANVHRYGGTLPKSRQKLYDQLFQVILSPRDERDPEQAREHAAAVRERLAALAYRFMTAGTVVLARNTLTASLAAGTEAAAALQQATANGILVELDNEQLSFAHLTFQEYLAAEHIRRNGLVDVLIDGVDSAWWREVILLWAAAQSTDEIIRACLDSERITALSLAFECADLDQAVDPQLRERLRATVDAAFQPGAGPERRRIVAGIEALRYLRRTVPTESGSRLCAGPVPSRLYWLFVQDGHPAPDRPCHPDTTPARGMWGRDALDFVRWINRITAECGDPDTTYRLPTKTELTALAAGTDGAAEALRAGSPLVWADGGIFELPVLWTLPGRRSPAIVTGVELRTGLTGESADPGLMLDLLSLGIRSRAVLLASTVGTLAQRLGARRDALTVRAARPYTGRRVALDGSKPAARDRQREYFEAVPSPNPFSDDAEAAQQVYAAVEDVRAAVLELAAVINSDRDIGAAAAISDVRNAVHGDYGLAALHERCVRLGEAAERLAHSSVISHHGRVVRDENVAAVKTEATEIVQRMSRFTNSFRQVATVGNRRWHGCARTIGEQGSLLADPADAQRLLAAAVGDPLARVWRETVARRPAEHAKAFAVFVRALAATAGLSDEYRVEAAPELLGDPARPTGAVPGRPRLPVPLVELLRERTQDVLSRHKVSRTSLTEMRMAALMLAAADPADRNHLRIAAATIVVERRWAGSAQETIYLASM
ncbi:TIR domain-containing protein [Paractinoplanes rishiriensis]|uniref:TIR domain-containing protein n=1 Tax=Paractinoplanes rishiriensis TaxID=1050105 RepID=A0A919JXJ8_9ACTN|nr:TIR domain-containing protein [Actinoplanes rishiriensis]GIE95342.1 hypothetical protein Ari01nite_28070 [Actinoplanes rishiriensis]